MFITLKKMPKVVHIALFGGFVVWSVYFMLWPFMAIIFYQKFGLSLLLTGTILSLATFVSISLSVYGGYLSDRIGNRFMLKAGLMMVILSLVPALITDHLISYVIMLFGISASRGVLGTTFKVVIANEIKDVEFKKQSFYWFYFCINIGGALGPFLGVTFTLHYPQYTFLILLIICVIYAFVSVVFFSKHFTKPTDTRAPLSLAQSFKIIRQDYALLFLIVANMLIILVFGQMDSTLAQYFSRLDNSAFITLFSYLIVINCMMILIFQFPFLRLIARFSDKQQVYIGIVLFALAQIAFAATPDNFYLGWIIAVIFLSLGEIILFSVVNVQIDKLAPDNLKGAYFGVSNFYMFGLVLAPYVGSFLLKVVGRNLAFVVMLVLCCAIFILYRLAMQQHAKSLAQQKLAEIH
ncbi:MFS transporter [Cysteiniphilum litorale]|uniref:MFS transporter n=1 Tax=Cysteiniphilum litorale TaxID=2056700 RepID=UPI003F88419D